MQVEPSDGLSYANGRPYPLAVTVASLVKFGGSKTQFGIFQNFPSFLSLISIFPIYTPLPYRLQYHNGQW